MDKGHVVDTSSLFSHTAPVWPPCSRVGYKLVVLGTPPSSFCGNCLALVSGFVVWFFFFTISSVFLFLGLFLLTGGRPAQWIAEDQGMGGKGFDTLPLRSVFVTPSHLMIVGLDIEF